MARDRPAAVVLQEAAMDPWDLSVALFGGVAVMFFGASVLIALAG
jgi:hypothetical protein